MPKYDFFIAGRWRNYLDIRSIVDLVRAHGSTAYCFIDNQYEDAEVTFSPDDSIEANMQKLESLPGDDELVQRIFDNDMQALRASENFILVLPAGISGHVEAGAAYGMGKTCYAIGVPDKTETLYGIFDTIFPNRLAFEKWLKTR